MDQYLVSRGGNAAKKNLDQGLEDTVTELVDVVTLSIELGEDAVLGAHLLATMEGIADDDSAGYADVLRFTLQRGIADRLADAGIDWPPTAQSFELAESIGREVAQTDAAGTDADAESDEANGLRVRTVAIVAIALAAIVLIVGGYALKWSWTGFTTNDQLWDWLHLLLLPIAFGTFPLWLRYSEYMSPARRRALGAAVLVFFAFVLLGYLDPIGWTGFRGQTLWNWLLLIVLPISLMAVRAWPQTARELRRPHMALIALFGGALIVTLIGGYEARWAWTGYEGNTLWDWLKLVLAPIAVSTVVVPALVKLVSGGVDAHAAEDREQKAREKALQTARERAGEPA